MMGSDDSTTKDKSAAKTDPAPKTAEKASEGASKTEAGTSSDGAPASYSRGEGQKPISRTYRDNWSVIFEKKKKR
jgi:hypothetical protein